MPPTSFTNQLKILAVASTVIASAFAVQSAEARVYTLFEKALEDIDNDRLTAAEDKFKRLLEANPNDADAHTGLSRIYMRTDKLEAAAAEATKALALDPTQALAYSNRCYCKFKLGRMKEGFTDGEDSVKYYHVNPYDDSIRFTHRNLASAFKMTHQEAEANSEIAKARAYDLLIDAYKEREYGRLENGIKKVDEAIRLYPNEPDFYFLRGVLYDNQSKFGPAITNFSKALRLDPQATTLYYFRGDAYQQAGLHKQAIDDFTKIIEAKPRLAAYRLDCETGRLRNELLRDDTSPVSIGDIYFLRSQEYSALGKTKLATQDLNTTCSLNITDDKALAKRAELSMLNGKSAQAIADLTKSVNANPKDWARYVERADAYMQIGKQKEALADFGEVIKLAPNDAGAYTLRAVALKSMGRYNEAIEDFSKVLELDPNEDDAWMERSDCYRKIHQYKKALDDLKHVSKKTHQDGLLVDARVKIFAEMGNDKEASKEIAAANVPMTASAAPQVKRTTAPSFTMIIGMICAGLFLIGVGVLAVWKLFFSSRAR
ncbi:MAG TPA: tetratricopeptide repeat protein [Drouetiella sp.]